MITNKEKEDIFNNLCYFYTSAKFNRTGLKLHFNRGYNDEEEFKKVLFKENTRIFFRYAVTLKGKEFLNCIKNEFILFCTRCNIDNSSKIDWLDNTYNFIVPINGLSGFINKSDTVNFIKWYDKKVKKLQQKSQSIDVNRNRTKGVITETFENMDKKGWQYAFATEQDYNLFADLLTNFFEYKDYFIPETVIQLKRTCKTKVAKALGEMHAELSENPLNNDTEYFKIVKALNHFKEVSNFDLVKAMQR
ncbi:hypothetical protein [Mariniflexile sp. HMF6888]|uniref:hypothetical protein n=1 Tax=Mariniflexile sp. HMF6888 TaxID=3373086 RepID=UPI0037A89EB4